MEITGPKTGSLGRVYNNLPTVQTYPVITHVGSVEPGVMVYDDVTAQQPRPFSKNGLP